MSPDSTHHKVEKKRLSDWKDKWGQLGIFDGV